MAGTDNDNDSNNKDDDDDVALASAISLGLATLVLGSFANPGDLVVARETIFATLFVCVVSLIDAR